MYIILNINLVKQINIRHRACAQACKSVLVTLREVTGSFSFNVLVIFFDFSALGGPGFHPPRSRVHNPPPQKPCFFQKILSLPLPLLSLPFPSLVLACLGLSWPVLACLGWIFPSQLGPKNPPKSTKNRSQDVFPS